MYRTTKDPQTAKTILRKNKASVITFPVFKLSSKAIGIQTVWCWHKNRHIKEFPGGLVARMLGFHCCSPGSISRQATEIPQLHDTAKKKKKKNPQKHIDQWNRREGPEINPHIYGQPVYDRGAKSIQWEKDSLFKTIYCNIHMQKKETGPSPHLTPHTTINAKWIKALNVSL